MDKSKIYEKGLLGALDRSGIPERMFESIVLYIMQGIGVGGFLESVISDSLSESYAKADGENSKCLAEYARFFFNHAPADCWGSRGSYINWLKKGGMNNLFAEEKKHFGKVEIED